MALLSLNCEPSAFSEAFNGFLGLAKKAKAGDGTWNITFTSVLNANWPIICFDEALSLEVTDSLVKVLNEFVLLDVGCIDQVIKRIVSKLLMGKPNLQDEEKTITELQVFKKLRDLLDDMVRSMRSDRQVCSSLSASFPYHITNKPRNYTCFLYNYLQLLRHMQCKQKMITVFLDNLLWVDLSHNKRRAEHVFSESQTEPGQSSSQSPSVAPVVNDPQSAKLLIDRSLLEVFTWISSCIKPDGQNLDQVKCDNVYRLLFNGFSQIILPSDGCSHVQFIMFYICTFSENCADEFIDNLWAIIKNEQAPTDLRLKAIRYCASFVVRSKNVDPEMLLDFVEIAANWIQSYENKFKAEAAEDFACDFEKHAVFYRLFQAVIYVVVMRSHDLSEDAHKSLRLLNFQKMISSRLNPFGVCNESLLTMFSSLARHYQLALCASVIERNKRQQREEHYRDEAFAQLPFDCIGTEEAFQRLEAGYRKDIKELEGDGIPRSYKRRRTESYVVSDFALSVSPKDPNAIWQKHLASFLESDACSGTEEEGYLFAPMDISV